MKPLHVAAVLGTAMLASGAAGAATYDILLERAQLNEFDPEDQQPTFSGSGTVIIDDAGTTLEALSLGVETLAEVGGEPDVLTFSFGLGDVVATSGLDGPPAPDLSGLVIGLAGSASEGGEATLIDFGGGALTLDFGAGVASAFCVGEPEVQCVRGGGSSTGIEATLSAAIIPLPATLPLALTALGGLALWRRGGRAA